MLIIYFVLRSITLKVNKRLILRFIHWLQKNQKYLCNIITVDLIIISLSISLYDNGPINFYTAVVYLSSSIGVKCRCRSFVVDFGQVYTNLLNISYQFIIYWIIIMKRTVMILKHESSMNDLRSWKPWSCEREENY